MTGGPGVAEASAGRFGEAAMRKAAESIAGEHGLVGELVLLQLSNNAVFAIPEAAVVIRITRSQGLAPRAVKVAKLGGWFAEVDAPTIRLASSVAAEQPLDVGGLAATMWEYLQPGGREPEVEDLGLALRTFHRLGEPPFDLPVWDPVADSRARIADAEALDDDDRDFLAEWCAHLEPQTAALHAGQPLGLVHGDAHVGNLLRRVGGQSVFCDFDATCAGPWQYDLVAVPIGETRFGRPGVHARLAAAYGFDVTTDPAWPVLRQARELKMVVGALPRLASSTAVKREFKIRLQSIRRDEHEVRWTPFADLERGSNTRN